MTRIVTALGVVGRGLGAVRVGVASLEPSASAGAFRSWLARGEHAGMGWLARGVSARLDPGSSFPWARSAVMAAFPHEASPGEAGSLPASVARYARGEDYHRVLRGKLERMAAHLESLSGRALRSHVFVDTSAVPERELASRAGLGWIGKHTGLLTEDAGSWLLLGGFLTEQALPPSAPVPERCGTCRVCLDACPTGALPAPYRLDARRCISYLTIEHRGWIPRDLRPYLADWLYGCDLCQAACPWNEHAPEGLPELGTRPALAALSLEDVVLLPERRYTEAFRGSAMKRATRAGLRRNAMILAGNRRDPACREALEASLSDPDPVLRGTAGWALGRLGGSREALAGARERETDPEALEELSLALHGGAG